MARLTLLLLLLGCGDEPAPAVVENPVPQPSSSPPTDIPVAETALSPGPTECPPGTLPVPGGRFLMGSVGPEAGQDEGPVHPVRIDGFCMDRTEMAAADGKAPLIVERWADAESACAERGGRLPTEAEFEKAARGGCELGSDPKVCDAGDTRPYPWGVISPTCLLAVHSEIGPRGPKRCSATPVNVDSQAAGAGPYGHINLSGNLWEPTSDWYHPGIYRPDRPDNPGGPSSGKSHSIRGGGWDTFSTNMRISNRFSDHLTGSTIGVRCVFSGGTPTIEDIPALSWVNVTINVAMKSRVPISGRWLTVTAFSESDIGPMGLPAPGRSPVAEAGARPNGTDQQQIQLEVPEGQRLRFSAALDSGKSGNSPGPAASSGGVGITQAPATSSAGLQVNVALAQPQAHPHSPRP